MSDRVGGIAGVGQFNGRVRVSWTGRRAQPLPGWLLRGRKGRGARARENLGRQFPEMRQRLFGPLGVLAYLRPIDGEHPKPLGQAEHPADLVRRRFNDPGQLLGRAGTHVLQGQALTHQAIELAQQLSRPVGIRGGELEQHRVRPLGVGDGPLEAGRPCAQGAHPGHLFGQEDLCLGNGFLDPDQPPVGVGIVLAGRLPDHIQLSRKPQQTGDRGLATAAAATANQALGLARMDLQPGLSLQPTHGVRWCGLLEGGRGFITSNNRLWYHGTHPHHGCDHLGV